MIVFATFMYVAKTIIRDCFLGQKLSSVIAKTITDVLLFGANSRFAIMDVSQNDKDDNRNYQARVLTVLGFGLIFAPEAELKRLPTASTVLQLEREIKNAS